ncbi:MAG: hypothetical protein GY869_26330, partial [Planctomycetes bacterium]|nr:hypothetical protein [Planctomycetota bacterium]
MSNHKDHNNPNPTEKSSVNADRFFWKTTLPMFFRQWGWLAGILGFFLLLVAVSWNLTISRAAPYNQPAGGEGTVSALSVVEPTSSRGQSDAEMNELVAQLQELITVLKENDNAAGELTASLSQLDTISDTSVEEKPVDHKTSAERCRREYQRKGSQQGNRQKQTDQKQQQQQQQQEQVVDPNAAEDIENMGMSKEEKDLFDLFEQYAAAMENDPDSAETERLSKLLDAAMEKLNEKMENDPNVTTTILGGSKVDPKQQQVEQEPPVEEKQVAGEVKPPVTEQQQVNTAGPPVDDKQATGEIKPPVVEQQQVNAVEPPDKVLATGELPPPVENQQATGKTVDPETQKQVGEQISTPPTRQQVAANEATIGQAVAARTENSLVTTTVIRAKNPDPPPTATGNPAQTQLSNVGGRGMDDNSALQADPNDIVELTVDQFQLD